MQRLGRVLLAALAIAGASPAAAFDVQKSGDARWVSGGVGEEEHLDLVLALPDYNLQILTASERSGAYLSDARVTVRDAAGRIVFETVLDGPFLLARLERGRYEVQATYAGKALTRTVTIPASGRRELFLYWPAPDVENMPTDRAP